MVRLTACLVLAASILALSACVGPGPVTAVPVSPVDTPAKASEQAVTPAQPQTAAQTAQAEAFGAAPAADAATESPGTARPLQAATVASTPTVPAPAQTLPTAAASDRPATDARLPSMRDELFLAGAPSFALSPRCTMPADLPAGQHAATWTEGLDTGLLCLFGFGENETVRYEVWDAAGEMADSGEGVPDNLDGDPLPSVKVILYIAARAPGKWRVQAAGASGEASAEFAVQPLTEEGKPAVVLAFQVPLGGFTSGQAVPVAVYGLPEGSAPQLGVYAVMSRTEQQTRLKLREAAALEVDGGAAFVTLTLDPSYQPGEYCVVVQATSEYQPGLALSDLGAAQCFEVAK